MSDCARIRVGQFALNLSKYAVFDTDVSATNLDKARAVGHSLSLKVFCLQGLTFTTIIYCVMSKGYEKL
jgi:hypothetical protein